MKAILTSMVVMTLAACTTVNPYTKESETSNVVKGGAIGAAAGAVIGALTGHDSRERRKRALIGAGAGAIAGGSVGYYMDVQEAKLRQQLDGTGVSVTRHGDEIVLNMPGNITFAVDSSQIETGFLEVLGSVALVLDEYDKTLVEVTGHTDSTGSDAYNQQLSENRASTVGQVLSRNGVAGQRIATAGFGERYPVASNESESGRSANRRVELTLVPLAG